MTDKVIWKWEFDGRVATSFEMPKGAQILHAALDGREREGHKLYSIWALVDPNAEKEKRTFVVMGTGWKRDAGTWARLQHVSTVQEGGFVWHIFEEKSYA